MKTGTGFGKNILIHGLQQGLQENQQLGSSLTEIKHILARGEHIIPGPVGTTIARAKRESQKISNVFVIQAEGA